MKVVELFAGTCSLSNVAKEKGHNTWTSDFNPKFNVDLVGDILDPGVLMKIKEQIKDADFVWMSPPCTTFSLASGNTHWTADRLPKTDNAVKGLQMLKICEDIAKYCIEKNKKFIIENPNGRAVWFLPDVWLKRAWYCQYGDTRAKPTNIWTNIDMDFRTCRNFKKGEEKHCHHESAPRGSKTGTQGLKGNMERSVVPKQLCIEIIEFIEGDKR